jgi:phosphoglycolate phosphatase-like HAD superfamily hydrolase
VIFDCDGVLVDSERIAGRAFANLLREIGLDFTLPEMIETFEHRMGPHHGARVVARAWTDVADSEDSVPPTAAAPMARPNSRRLIECAPFAAPDNLGLEWVTTAPSCLGSGKKGLLAR